MTPKEFRQALRQAISSNDERTPEQKLNDQLMAIVAENIDWLDRDNFEDACAGVIDAYWDRAGVNA